MSAGSKRPRSPFEMDNVDSVGITELTEDVYTCRWHINNFKKIFENRNPMDKIMSPLFKNSNDASKRLQWKFSIKSSQNNIYLRLYLVNYKEPTEVGLQFALLDSQNKPRKTKTKDYTFISSDDEFCISKMVKIAKLFDPSNNLLEEDTLRIHCRITVKVITSQLFPGPKAEAGKYAASGKNCFTSDLDKLFSTSALSDVSIQTTSATLKAHKAILSCRSSFFAAMFRNQMFESINSIVKILHFDHGIVSAMLKYIYCGEISEDVLATNCLEIFKIAHLYYIKGLKEEAEEYAASHLSIENVVDSLILADMYEVPNLKEKAIEFFNMNKAKLMNTGGSKKITDYKPLLLLELYHRTH